MKYSASEKLEIIQLVEESALPVRQTLEKIGIPRATFYRWYDLYRTGGPEALDDRHPTPEVINATKTPAGASAIFLSVVFVRLNCPANRFAAIRLIGGGQPRE